MRSLPKLFLIGGLPFLFLALFVSLRRAGEWNSFSSRLGYTISYPPGWSYAECVDGYQVRFESWTPAYDCQGIEALGVFTIEGPLSPQELATDLSSPLKKRIGTYDSGAKEIIRYIDSSNQVTYPMIYDVIVSKSGQSFLFISYREDATDSAEVARMMESFHTK